MRTFIAVLAAVLLVLDALRAEAVMPQPGEFDACRQWCERVFGRSAKPPAAPFLELVRQDTAADGVTRGKSWRGTPYRLGDREYAHGLAYNATKYFRVRLGRPGERFTADVGLENNDDTQRGAAMGNGSVRFHVRVGDREVFATPVLRLQDGAKPLDVPLDGAQEFEIGVDDGGDGRGWDQALWAEAAVRLQDGTRLRLQDLPAGADAEANPYGFSFLYHGKPSAALLEAWPREFREGATNAQRSVREVAFRDPESGLEIRAEATLFHDFPAVEWVVHLSNRGKADTPVLEAIQAFDARLPAPAGSPPLLHWAKGAVASFDDFAPQETGLKPGAPLRLQPGGGRSSSQVLPFFNLEGAGGGVLAAVGWTGEWAAEFAADAEGRVSMKAGMARTHLRLHPGETIRTPRMLLLFYQGDRDRGQNLLRQFLLTHHRPRRDGQPLVAPLTFGTWGGTRAEVHLDNIRQIAGHGLPVEYYWIDAEWFGAGPWWANAGNWAVKKELYPEGFRPLSQALRESGRELLLWFEPERVVRDTPWHREHREWLIDIGRDSLLLNLGLPEARKFLTDFISAKVDEFGLGAYRQDFNFEPLPYWQAADAPDRQGMTEIRHIEGLYAFWDELLARHPRLIIDNCASGGRRLDLETLGRATPLWRTDGPRDPVAHQCHTLGLLPWIPLSSTSADRAGDNYDFRSSLCSALCLNWDSAGHIDAPSDKTRPDFPFDWARRTLEQYVQLRPLYYGDYHALTAYSQGRDVWAAYQLDRADLGQGLVVALRREQSPYGSARFPLRGLEAQAEYRVANLDTGGKSVHSGKELMEAGLEVRLESRPDSVLLWYERK